MIAEPISKNLLLVNDDVNTITFAARYVREIVSYSLRLLLQGFAAGRITSAFHAVAWQSRMAWADVLLKARVAIPQTYPSRCVSGAEARSASLRKDNRIRDCH